MNPEIPNQNSNEAHLKRLLESARSALSSDEQTKLQIVFRDKFIDYENANHVVVELMDALGRPVSERPPAFALVGPSGGGKTAIVHQLLRRTKSMRPDSGDEDATLVLVVKTISRATEPRTWLSIARALNMTVPAGNARVPMNLGDTVIRRLKAKGVRMVVFSQFSHVEPVSRDERRNVFDLLQSMSDEGIIFVIVALERIMDLIGEEEELVTRVTPLRVGALAPIKRVTEKMSADEKRRATEFLSFLMSLEAHYPFESESGLFRPEIAKPIYNHSKGIVGEVIRACNDAARWAIKRGHKCITPEALKAAGVPL